MTVSSQTSNETFNGNGVTTVWDLPFRFFHNDEIFVYLVDPAAFTTTPLILGTDYTLTGAGLPEQFGTAPGKITTTVAVPNLKQLYVERVMPIEQLTDIVNQGRFFPEMHEDVFDRLTMLIQQSDANSRGAIRVAIGDPEPARLPAAPLRANLLMAFDGLGNPTVVAPTPDSSSALALMLANDTLVTQGAAMIGRGAQVVKSIVELKTLLVNTPSKFAYVTGYYAQGDGGGGLYYLDLADVSSTDNGGTVIVASDGGRWKLTYQDHVTTAQFGAKLDGTATDDVPAIQRALNWAKTAGVPVVMPAGKHVILTHLSIPTGVSFSGVGSFMPINYLDTEQTGSRLLIKHGAGVPDGPFTIGAQTGSTFRNFRIIYPNQTLTNPPVAYPFLIGGEVDDKGLYNDILVERLFLFNVYRFSSFRLQNGRICIQDIFGDVYNTGISMDNGLDCNYVRRIHFWAFSDITASPAQQTAIRNYKTANLIGAVIDRADGLFFSDFFLIFGKKGVQLGSAGQVPYGVMNNLSFDAVQYGIDARYVGVQSLTITNVDYAMSSVIMSTFGMVDSAPIVDTLQMGTLLVNNLCVWTEATSLVLETATSAAAGTLILNNPFITDTLSKRIVSKQGAGDVIVRDLRVAPTSINMLCGTSGTKAATFINPDFNNTGSVYWDGAGPAPQVSSADDGTVTTIASANSINIPPMPQKKRFLITGSTTINGANLRPAGEQIDFQFLSACTVNTGASFSLGSNFVGSPGSTLALVSNGTQWIQRSRTIL